MFRRTSSSFLFSTSLALLCSTTSASPSKEKRFATPWADAGLDPANIHTSSNPLLRKKRDDERAKEFYEGVDADVALDNHITRDKEIHMESQRKMRENVTNFQPIGGGAGVGSTSKTSSFPHEHIQNDDEIATISSGFFSHLEDYRAAARIQNPHVDVDLNNFLPLPQSVEEILKVSNNYSKFPYGGRVGFAIDMDGVLIRGKPSVGVKIIEGAPEAIEFLQRSKIPFVLMTNGGGNLESVLAKNLSRRMKLKVPLCEDQVMVSTTPMKALIASDPKAPLRTQPVLVMGPYPSAAKVLESYGFTNVVHMRDFQARFPQFTPLQEFWGEHEVAMKKALEGGDSVLNDRSRIPRFAAAFIVSAKGVDAFNDYQVLQDVVLGIPSGQAGGDRVAPKQTIPVYFASEDLFWPASPKIPRLGFGAMKEMFSSIFETVTGEPMNFTTYGKPRRIAYLYAQKLLREQNKKLGWHDNKAPDLICMIGDNIDTDITGANAMNCVGSGSVSDLESKWMSVHVMTGVGRVPPACRSIPETDKELEWLSTHFVDPAPHYVAPTFRHFVGELCHFDEKQITQMHTVKHILPNPVDVKGLYNWDE